MAYIDNTQTKKEIEDAIRGNSVSNIAPSKVSENVQLVCNVNPKDYRRTYVVKNAQNSTINTSVTIYTTPTDKDFFLTGYSFGVSNDAASTATSISIKATPILENTSTSLVEVFNIVGTANYNIATQTFDKPILLKRNSTITNVIGGAAVGVCKTSATIYGYWVD